MFELFWPRKLKYKKASPEQMSAGAPHTLSVAKCPWGRDLEGSGLVAVTASVVVDMHLQHLLALHLLVRVLLRLIDGVEVAGHTVTAIEGVDADDAELSLRGFP